MTDHENMDDEMIEVSPASPAADPPADLLAFMTALLTTINSASQCTRRVKELRRETAIAEKAKAESAAGQTDLAAARAAFDQHCAREDAALAARAGAVSKAEVELFGRKNAVAAREDAAREVENAWGHLFESEYVRSGFQSAEFSPLEKARRWLAGLPVVSTDSDYAADAKIDTSDTDPAARGNDPTFIETLPPGATLARAAQSPPRSAQARRTMRRAAEH
jgi:hypothetical protein